VALVALVVLSSAGCRLDVDVAIDVDEDGAGTIAVTVSADAELAAQAPGAVADVRTDDATAAGWTVAGPTTGDDGGVTLTLTKPFRTPEEATAILAEINGPSGPLHALTLGQQRDFARVTTSLTGTTRLDGGVAAVADQALIDLTGSVPLQAAVAEGLAGADPATAIGLTVRVDAPGSVVETTGTEGSGEVVWQPDLTAGTTTELQALFEQRDRTAERARTVEDASRVAIIVWLVVVALLAGLVALLLARHRQAR
jgi:hypothetical protein